MLWQRSGSQWMTSLTILPLELGLRLFRYPKGHDPNLHILICKQGKRSFKWPHYFPVDMFGAVRGCSSWGREEPKHLEYHSGSQLLFYISSGKISVGVLCADNAFDDFFCSCYTFCSCFFGKRMALLHFTATRIVKQIQLMLILNFAFHLSLLILYECNSKESKWAQWWYCLWWLSQV